MRVDGRILVQKATSNMEKGRDDPSGSVISREKKGEASYLRTVASVFISWGKT